MEYKIIYSDENTLYTATADLAKKVTEYLKKGWKPQGSVSVATVHHGYSTYYTLCQAMIKYDQ